MCGRYDLSETGRTLRIGAIRIVLSTPRPRYNVAPTQTAPIIRRGDAGPALDDFRWGLIPWWAKSPSLASKGINARVEGVAQNPFFREAFRKRRCVVPADGYFEWQKTGKTRRPWRFVRRDRQPLLMAGVWETWRPPDDPDAPPVRTFAILTTTPNADTAAVHDRMPLILESDAAAVWLDPDTPVDQLLSLGAPPAAGALERFRVSPVVNSSLNDTPECVQRLSGEQEGGAQPELW